MKDFSDTLERVDGMRYKVSKVKLLVSSLSKESTNLETKLTVFGGHPFQYKVGLGADNSSKGCDCRGRGSGTDARD